MNKIFSGKILMKNYIKIEIKILIILIKLNEI